MTKQCSKCKEIKPLSEFYTSIRGRKCKACHSAAQKAWGKANPEKLKDKKKRYAQKHKPWLHRRQTLSARFAEWQRGAERRGIEFNLTQEYIETFPMICHYTGQHLTLERNKLNTMSLDRLDNSKGYIVNNVVFCCADINRMKSIYSADYFVDICKKVAHHIG